MKLSTRRRAVATLVAVLLIVGVTTACGGDEDPKEEVIPVAAGELGPDPFFAEALGRDREGLTPRSGGGVRPGSTPGLYGGTLNKSSCDKAALADFLTDRRNAKKATAWSRVRGIDIKNVRRYIRGLTPVLLRTDTLVRNHGFRNGVATIFESLLEAGIAVLVDRIGQPVVKCNCGNPLAAPSVSPGDVDTGSIPDAEWRDRYDRDRTTTVKPGKKPKRIGRFRLLDLDSGKGIGRTAGTDAARDVRLPAPPPLPPAGAGTGGPEPSDAAPSSAGPTRSEIVGTWESAGERVRVEERGPDTFTGRTASDNEVADGCVVEAGREIWTVNGSGPRYTGTVVSVDPQTCQDVERFDATWELTGTETLKVCATVAQQQGCNSLTRVTE
ncbi:DUF6777 domain-containing protein [Streptomyces spectabilis]|uniref:DUF6777 domain-containing protein n=1 Tax=Streptomyces spectabilis TaxID=68270 RepID=A0A7W8APF8_STRST|nr:DUF6777 domain-containing protein [Streptomyces spectabilis]MBB5102174.1 hypothetical protein [Streptomyces spectabilis]MCI3907222.1 hypothetical protein [Streptomyces spectabilis]